MSVFFSTKAQGFEIRGFDKRSPFMRKVTSFLIFLLLFLIIPSFVYSSTRGISALSKQGQPLQLYDSYNALVVGISEYQNWPDLPHAVGDAEEVAKRLKKMGFKVKLVINPELIPNSIMPSTR